MQTPGTYHQTRMVLDLYVHEKGLDLSFFSGISGLERSDVGILIELQMILHSVGGQVQVGLGSDAVRSDCTWTGRDHQLFPDVMPDKPKVTLPIRSSVASDTSQSSSVLTSRYQSC